MSLPSITPQTSLRLGLGAALLALGLAGMLLRTAQGGPSWEVPSAVVAALYYGSILALLLLVGATIALFHATWARTLPPLAIAGASAVFLLAGLWTALVLLGDSVQWPVHRPVLSQLAEATAVGLLLLSGPVFWFLGFWALPEAPYRRGIPAVGLAVASSLVVGLVSLSFLAWLS